MVKLASHQSSSIGYDSHKQLDGIRTNKAMHLEVIKCFSKKIPVNQFLSDFGIRGRVFVSEEPDLELHTIELDKGMSIVFKEDTLVLQQEKTTGYVDHGEFTNLGKLVGMITEQLE